MDKSYSGRVRREKYMKQMLIAILCFFLFLAFGPLIVGLIAYWSA